MKLVTQNNKKKVTVFKKYLLLKKQLLGRSARFEKVHALNNYLFWRKSSSKTVAALSKIICSI